MIITQFLTNLCSTSKCFDSVNILLARGWRFHKRRTKSPCSVSRFVFVCNLLFAEQLYSGRRHIKTFSLKRSEKQGFRRRTESRTSIRLGGVAVGFNRSNRAMTWWTFGAKWWKTSRRNLVKFPFELSCAILHRLLSNQTKLNERKLFFGWSSPLSRI